MCVSLFEFEKKIAFCVPWAKRMTCSHVIKFQENCDLCFLCHVNHFESTEGENMYASEVIVILESKLVVLSLQSELEFTQEVCFGKKYSENRRNHGNIPDFS